MSLPYRRGKLVSFLGGDAGRRPFRSFEISILHLLQASASQQASKSEVPFESFSPPSVGEVKPQRDDEKADYDLVNPAYWIAFGPHGPRALPPPGQNWFIFWSVMGITGICCVVFFIIRLFARPPPSTMTREWQEATNEYLRVRPPRLRLSIEIFF